MTRKILTLSMVIVIFSGVSQAGDNWPSWRGPTGMGQTDEKDLPLTWSDKTQENVLWKVALFPSDKVRRDQNQSSPIVWGERVFVTSSYWPEGVSEKEYPEHHLTCFTARTGERAWDVTIPPGPWKLRDLRGGYTAPTPACDGTHVYVLFGSSVLAAVDFAGKIVWRKEITPFAFDVAIGTSPVVFGETVLVSSDQIGGQNNSKLYAFSGKTGDIVWQIPRAVDWGHSTPTLAKIAGKTQLLLATANGPQAIDPSDGKVIWQFKSKDRVGDTVSPTVIGDLVYVDSGRGGPAIAVEANGSGEANLRWRLGSISEGFSSPVVVGDYLVRLNSPGTITCRKWADGMEVFKERLQGVDPAVSPFVTADGRIYCASAGKSYVLKAAPKAEILAQNDLGDPGRASPAVAAGRIYLKGSRFLFCIGKK